MPPSGGHILAPSFKHARVPSEPSASEQDAAPFRLPADATDAFANLINERAPAIAQAAQARATYHANRHQRLKRKLRNRAEAIADEHNTEHVTDEEAHRAARKLKAMRADGEDGDDAGDEDELGEDDLECEIDSDDERPPDEMLVVAEGSDALSTKRRHAAVHAVPAGATRDMLDALTTCCASGGVTPDPRASAWADTTAGADAVPLGAILDANSSVANLLSTTLDAPAHLSTGNTCLFRGRAAALAACFAAVPMRHGDAIIIQWPPPQDAFPEGCAEFASQMSASRGVRVYFWPPSRDDADANGSSGRGARKVRYDVELVKTLMGALATTGRVRLLVLFQGSAVAGHAFDAPTMRQLHGILMDQREKQQKKGMSHVDADATHLLVDATAIELYANAASAPPIGVGGDFPYAPAAMLTDHGLVFGAPGIAGTRVMGARSGALANAARHAPRHSAIEHLLASAVERSHSALATRARASLASSLADVECDLSDCTDGALTCVACHPFVGCRLLVSCDWLRASSVERNPYLPSARDFAARLAVARGLSVSPISLLFGRCPTNYPNADHLEDCFEVNAASGGAQDNARALGGIVASLGRSLGALQSLEAKSL